MNDIETPQPANQPRVRPAFVLFSSVSLLAVFLAVGVPNFLRGQKRARATAVLQDLRAIDAAIDQYAIEPGKLTNEESMTGTEKK